MGDIPADRLERRVARERVRLGPGDRLAALERGLEGERNDGESLRLRLSGLDVCVEHSLRLFQFGDIDHLTVGPGGVTVIDSKAWTGEVSVVRGMPKVGSWSKRSELAKVQRQVTAVRIALSRIGTPGVGVQVLGILCLAGHEQRPLVELHDGLKLGGAAAAADLANRPGSRGAGRTAELMRALVRELPRVSRKEVDELEALTGSLERTVSPRPRRPAAAHAPRTGRPSRSRRRRRGPIELVSGLAGLALVLAASSYLSHLPKATGLPVTGVALSRAHGHATVHFRAAAGERVAITLTAGTHAHRRVILTTGLPQHWDARHLGSLSQSLTATVCVSDTQGACVSPATTTSLARGAR
jgi:Nuclease-related domain